MSIEELADALIRGKSYEGLAKALLKGEVYFGAALRALQVPLERYAYLDAIVGQIIAQKTPLKDRLVGTWKFTSKYTERADGSRFDLFGLHPNGVVILSRDGHFAVTNTRPGRARFASGNGMQGSFIRALRSNW